MNIKNKLLYVLTSTFALTLLMSVPVSALSTATMSLSGASNTSGNFSVVVYENTGADTVTTAYVTLDFSSAVSNVIYDYSVGPFKTPLPSGAHSVTGEVTGRQAVARVTFHVPQPSTVTATVSPSSFLKHAVRDSSGTTTGMTETFVMNRGSTTFTYDAPAQPNDPSPNVPTETPAPTPGQGQKPKVETSNARARQNQTAVVTKTATSASETKPKSSGSDAKKSAANDDKEKKEVAGGTTDQPSDPTATQSSGDASLEWLELPLVVVSSLAIGYAIRRYYQRQPSLYS